VREAVAASCTGEEQTMFERIVVGVAKIERARKAARCAIDLGGKLGAEVHLVTAFDTSGSKSADRERKHAEGFLESMALEAGRSVRLHALPGDPADAILQVASEVNADLIVVGNKGMHGASRILGSVPNHIAHKAVCSVLIVDTD
jgi:nucleotide-binding universal stress UspA family protein